MSVREEPVAVTAAVTAAVNATIGVLTITGIVSPEVGGAFAAAAAAWIVAAAAIVRSRVTPIDR